MPPVTAQQERICRFVAAYRERNGVSPTYREIGENLGVTKQAIQYQVRSLESLGYLAKPRDARSVMVTSLWKQYRRHQVDRETNPMVAAVADERPELFDRFEEDDWDSLYSTRGVGGALTKEGVVAVAERISHNKVLRQQVAELLENGSVREQLIEVIEGLWKQVQLSSGKGRTKPAAKQARTTRSHAAARKRRAGRTTKGEQRDHLAGD